MQDRSQSCSNLCLLMNGLDLEWDLDLDRECRLDLDFEYDRWRRLFKRSLDLLRRSALVVDFVVLESLSCCS